jgi:hypothetical protein
VSFSHAQQLSAENAAATSEIRADARAAVSLSEDLLEAAAAIDENVAAAEGKVLDPDILTAETARADRFRAAADDLTGLSANALKNADLGEVSGAAWYWEYDTARELLNSVDFTAGETVATKLLNGIPLTENIITVAVAAWEVEQERLAEVARVAEAERVARAAAEEARNAQPNVSAPWSPPVTSQNIAVTGQYVVNVRATATGSNAQAQIDAGGQVAVTYSATSGTVVSAHNHNDSRALNLRVGDIVTFTGAITGTYRVTGSKDVVKGQATVADLKSLGVQMMMQTCYFNSNLMRIVGMVPA